MQIAEVEATFGTIGVVGLHGHVFGKPPVECDALTVGHSLFADIDERASGLDTHRAYGIFEHAGR